MIRSSSSTPAGSPSTWLVGVCSSIPIQPLIGPFVRNGEAQIVLVLNSPPSCTRRLLATSIRLQTLRLDSPFGRDRIITVVHEEPEMLGAELPAGSNAVDHYPPRH